MRRPEWDHESVQVHIDCMTSQRKEYHILYFFVPKTMYIWTV